MENSEERYSFFSAANISKLREDVAKLTDNIGNLPFVLEEAIKNKDVDKLKQVIDHIEKSDDQESFTTLNRHM